MKYKEYEMLNFNSTYKAKKYPKKMWPILNEYFSRYKHEFELTDDEIKEKLEILVNNLDSISIEIGDSSKYAGAYYQSKKHINIKVDKIRMNEEDILCTIFHELNHVEENRNSEQSTSFEQYNSKSKRNEGIALNEIITEMKAARLARTDRMGLDKEKRNPQMYIDSKGYQGLLFMGTMLHTTLGITEKEFLKYADKGKEEFLENIKNKFPDSDSCNYFIEKMIFFSDVLHTIGYNINEKNKIDIQEQGDNIRYSLLGIYKNCLYAMGKIIPQRVFINKDNIDMKEYMEKCAYNLEMIKENMKKGNEFFIADIKLDNEMHVYLDKFKNKILALESVEKSKDKFNDEKYCEILSEFVEGNLHIDYLNEIKEKYDVEHNKYSESNFAHSPFLEYKLEMLKSEYGGEKWDNTKCIKSIQKFLKGDSIIIKAFNKIKSFRQNKLYKALPAVSVNSLELINYSDKQTSEIDKLKDLVVENPSYEENTKTQDEPTIEKEDR